MRSPRFFLLFALGLGLCSRLVHDPPPQERLVAAATSLQQRVDRACLQLNTSVAATLRADTLAMYGGHGPGESGMRLFHGPQVVAWTDHAPIGDAELDSARGAHLVLPDGIYLHVYAIRGNRSVHALRRIWFKPPFENPFLKNHFEPGFTLNRGIVAETGPGLGSVVRDAQGLVMFRLQWADDAALPGTGSLISLLLAAVSIICAVWALWRWAMARRGAWVPVLLFVPPLLGARIATLAHGSFMALASYPLFDPSLFASSFFMPSLGDLLINVAVLLCASLFVHRAMGRASVPSNPRALALMAVAVLFLAAAGTGSVLTALVHDSSVSLDLFRVQGFDGYSYTALLAIGLLLAAWCILADAFIKLLTASLPGRTMLAMALLAATVLALAHHLAGNYDLVLAGWPLPVLWLLFRIRKHPGSIPALLLIAVLALFTAHVLNRQTLKRQERDRDALAETAAAREDPVVELLFSEAGRELRRDPLLGRWLRGSSPCTAVDLDHLVRQPFFTGYWDRYDIRIHLVLPGGRGTCSTSPDAPSTAQAIEGRYEQGVPVAPQNGLRVTDRPGEDALYIGRLELDSAQIFVEIRPRLVADGLGFPELLLAGERPSAFKAGRFARARYERGVLTSSSGNFVFPVAWHRALPPDGSRWTDHGFDLLAQGDPHAALVIIGIPIPSWWDHVTTFSFLFLLYCLLAAAMAGIGFALGSPYARGAGIGGKVRMGVAGFAIISLLLFAYGMRQLLDARRDQRGARTMDERSRGVLAELRQTLRGEGTLNASMAPYLDHLLAHLSNVFFTDLTLYAPNGEMLATSREQVFNTGLLGRRMDPRAFQRLSVEGAASFTNAEHIGTASFSTAYMPFRNDQGEVLAYLALPYFARQGEMEQERASSYAALVNIFTLLFLLSVVAATLITHWTTRPLELLRRGLERIGLGARNEPINYRGRDELGQLVKVYNRKVEELRESALKLARSEREHAWSEMARQVAHEIKNPLTPMRLNVQHFQQTWNPDAPDARGRLDRFSNNLVEQIDVLSRIAGEFSNFAQLPPAHPVHLDLSSVAQTVVQLFANTPGAKVELHTSGPLPVLADKEHLVRIFTNLVKNALQAMPEWREALVEVRLYTESDNAVAEVKDNGAGIPEEHRNRIFQPSFTTKSSGMGLGLAMVQRMVENAGGKVWFTTEEGKGSSFFVALPLHHSE